MREKVMKNKKICVAANCVRHKKNQGITLVALVITIVIMLILSTVTIGAINGGLFEYAGKAKKDTEEVSKTTGIEESFILAKEKSKTGRITASDMQNALDKIFGENYAEAMENGSTIVVKIGEKYYEVDSNGNVGEGKTLEPIEYAGDLTKGNAYNGNTKETAFRIECIEDLVAFSKNVNTGTTYEGKYIILVNDLDFNSIFSYSDFTAKYSFDESSNAYVPDEESQTAKSIKELCTTGQGFIPIGNSTNSKGFCGNFDGKFNNKANEIKNIYIKRSDNAALFGACGGIYTSSPESIKNITINGSITCTGSGTAAGFIGGSLTYGFKSVENCVNKAKIINTGTYNAVGLASRCDYNK